MNADIQALLELNRQYVRSAQESDVKWYAENLAEDFHSSTPGGALEDKAAFVAVDTEFRGVASGSFFHGDKMLILPSAGAVFASRGERTFLHWVFNWYLTALQTHDFDAIKGNLLQVARAQFAAYREQCKAHAVPADHFENIQLVVVGYSEQEEQFIGLNVTRRSGDPDFMLKRMETGIVSPEFKRRIAQPASRPTSCA